jgi:hypothetical protein
MSNSGNNTLPQPNLLPIMSEAEKFKYWTEYAARAKRDNETYARQLRHDKDCGGSREVSKKGQPEP